RPQVAEALLAALNAGVTPMVPRYGSVGCSGDLAPLAHVALVLVGEGEATAGDGDAKPAAQALRAAGLKPLKLETKEGLSLINGTDGMLGMLSLACADAEMLFRTADITAAMSIEGLLGTDRPFQAHLHEIRPHPGQVASAANLALLLSKSEIVASHRHSRHAVQDSYSMRCSPQVAGAARDTLDFARRTASVELASAIDNPVELMVAARALDLRAPLQPSPATGAVRALGRKHIKGMGPDRVMAPELAAAVALVRSGEVIAAAEAAAGRLR